MAHWYTSAMEATTEDDERTAKLATDLLADQGHPDLEVSGDQVVRWRKVDAIPVAGSRRGGRGQRARYLPTAPAAAAGIALALDTDRNIDRAVIAAFGSGAPIAETGLRSAIVHVLRQVEEKFRRAYGLRNVPRSSVPRSERVPLRHSREAAASLVADAILAPLLDERPLAGRDATAFAIEELAGEAAEVMTPDVRRRIEFVMGRLGLASLRHAARHVDVDRWQEACGWVHVVVDWGSAIDELVTMTGQDRSTLGIAAPLAPLIRWLREADERAHYAGGYQVAMMGLVVAAMTRSPRRVRLARETVEAMPAWARYHRAVAALVADLPERWRPALAAGGGAYVAALPEQERDDLLARIRAWREEQPEWSEVLPVPGRQSLAESPDTT